MGTKTTNETKRKRRPIAERQKPLNVSIDELNPISAFANIIYDKFSLHMMNESYEKKEYLTSDDINKVIASGSNGAYLNIEFHLYPEWIDHSWANGHFEDGIKTFAKINRYLNYSNENGKIKLENSDLYPYFNISITDLEDGFFKVKIYSRRKFSVTTDKYNYKIYNADEETKTEKKSFFKRLFSKSSK